MSGKVCNLRKLQSLHISFKNKNVVEETLGFKTLSNWNIFAI